MLLPETNAQTQTLNREWETLEHSSLNGISPSKPSPQGPGNPVQEKGLRAREKKEH